MKIAPYIFAVLLVVVVALIREMVLRHSRQMRPIPEAEVLRHLRIELKRGERFGYTVALVLLEFLGPSPKHMEAGLLDQVMPEEHLRQETREYDLVLRLSKDRFCLVLPHHSQIDIRTTIAQRLSGIAEACKWSNFKTAIAVSPDDALDSEGIWKICLDRLERTNPNA